MKFKYRKLNLNSPFAKKRLLRPIIPISIQIKNSRRYIRYEALIDSGADFNILPKGLIEILKIDTTKLKEIYFTGVEGEIIKGSIAKVILRLEEYAFTAFVVFAEISGTSGILGQYGFFDKFIVKFDLQEEIIEIRRKE